MIDALTQFAEDVREHRFPAKGHAYGGVGDGELAAFEHGVPGVLAKHRPGVGMSPCPQSNS